MGSWSPEHVGTGQDEWRKKRKSEVAGRPPGGPGAFGRSVLCLVGLGLCLAGSGCADHVSRQDLLAQIEAGSAPRIVDVRSRSEYEASHVPGAVHVPFASMLFHLDALPESRDEEGAPLVLYCEHGPRAGLARAQLWMAGAGPVLFMEGHMTAWKSDGLPVEEGTPSVASDATDATSGPAPTAE